jgi:hypothetical protein
VALKPAFFLGGRIGRMAAGVLDVGNQMAAWHATKRQIHELVKRLKFIHDCLSKGDGTSDLDAEGRELVTVIGQLYELLDAQLTSLQQIVEKATEDRRSAGLAQNRTMPS